MDQQCPRLEGWPTVVVMTTISPGSNDRDPVPPSVCAGCVRFFTELLSYTGTVTRPQYTALNHGTSARAKGRYVYWVRRKAEAEARQRRKHALALRVRPDHLRVGAGARCWYLAAALLDAPAWCTLGAARRNGKEGCGSAAPTPTGIMMP